MHLHLEINDLHISAGPQRSREERPHGLVVAGADGGHRVVSQALHRGKGVCRGWYVTTSP